MTEHVRTRKTLSGFSLYDFESILQSAMLKPTHVEIMRCIYNGHMDFQKIGEKFGYSESGIKKIHAKCLRKIAKIL